MHGIQTFATNTSTNSVLNNIFDPIIQFIKDLSPFAYVGVTIAVLVVGVMFLGGRQSREAAKVYLPWIFVGAVLIVGACTIGQAIPDAFSF